MLLPSKYPLTNKTLPCNPPQTLNAFPHTLAFPKALAFQGLAKALLALLASYQHLPRLAAV